MITFELLLKDYEMYYLLAPDIDQDNIIPYMDDCLRRYSNKVRSLYPDYKDVEKNILVEMICKDLSFYLEVNKDHIL